MLYYSLVYKRFILECEKTYGNEQTSEGER